MVVRGTAGPAIAPADRRSLIAGIRPEDLALAADGLAVTLTHTRVSRLRHRAHLRLRRRRGAARARAGTSRAANESRVAPRDSARSRASLRCRKQPTLPRGDAMTAITRRRLIAGASGALALPAIVRAAPASELSFFYPVTVSAPMAEIIDGYCRQYAKETGVEVKAVYAGTYRRCVEQDDHCRARRRRPAIRRAAHLRNPFAAGARSHRLVAGDRT